MRYLIFLIFCIAFSTSHAQTTTDSVKAAVDNLFTAMRNADSAALIKCFAPGAILQTIVKDKQGIVSIRTDAVTSFASKVAEIAKNAADERIVYDVIKIDDALASVWTPYTFYYQQQKHHCGANSFQLVRLAEGWKIQYLIDTRHKNGCE
ncbi:hypothetical protein [Chitinophaga tropicalis]|uniref:Nuclear transport factor 2 family protein n=1 Tax=Chitinophaga tropicalis TaxID=2683588 RepID=A0A7K1U0W2_9BACT|nr:hypothetical protein [Chitinophaga tropicalis]MVT08007.1 hypothetical protein [Chitinophaga tropicalis]